MISKPWIIVGVLSSFLVFYYVMRQHNVSASSLLIGGNDNNGSGKVDGSPQHQDHHKVEDQGQTGQQKSLTLTNSGATCSSKSPCNVLLWGDSLTVGTVHDRGADVQLHPYSLQLEERLGKLCEDCFVVVNEGVAGERTDHMLVRLEKFLHKSASSWQFAVLLGGTNDMNDAENRASDVAGRLGEMLDLLTGERGMMKILILGVPQFQPVSNMKHPVLSTEGIRQEINRLLEDEICPKFDPLCVYHETESLWLPWRDRSPDGVHPDLKGYDQLGDRVFDVLFQPLIDSGELKL